jgi:hypothetical protein
MANLQREAVASRMICEVTERFTSQSPPTNDAEANTRQLQHSAWLSAVSLIAHADNMTRFHPRVAAEILEKVRAVCDKPLPRDRQEAEKLNRERANCSSDISRICFADR